jgi:hypothetical protein
MNGKKEAMVSRYFLLEFLLEVVKMFKNEDSVQQRVDSS